MTTDDGARRPSRWEEQVRANPDHSHWYVERFRRMAAQGADLAGEARTVDAMLPRGSRVLDAGCGTGRVGAELAARGHTVVGVDVDPVLVAAAEADHPGPTWLVGDLAELDLPARGIAEPFDVAVCAGNVLTFLAPGTEVGCSAAWGPTWRPAAGWWPASVRVAATRSTRSSPTSSPPGCGWTSPCRPGTCARSRTARTSSWRCSVGPRTPAEAYDARS